MYFCPWISFYDVNKIKTVLSYQCLSHILLVVESCWRFMGHVSFIYIIHFSFISQPISIHHKCWHDSHIRAHMYFFHAHFPYFFIIITCSYKSLLLLAVHGGVWEPYTAAPHALPCAAHPPLWNAPPGLPEEAARGLTRLPWHREWVPPGNASLSATGYSFHTCLYFFFNRSITWRYKKSLL